MVQNLQGAGFVVEDKKNPFNDEPSYNDYAPPTSYAVHDGEKNTRQGVTLHPKDE